MITQDVFAHHIRTVLANLYSTADLQVNPVGELLIGDATVEARGSALRELILETIEALKPGAAPPQDRSAWAAYDVLRLRYIEGLTPQQVCTELNFSRASLYRHHERALDALTSLLWQRYLCKHDAERNAEQDRSASAVEEAVRLARQSASQPVSVKDLLEGVLQTLEPLAQRQRAALCWSASDAVTQVYGDPTTLRQVVLNVVTEALLRAGGETLSLTVGLERGRSTWCLRGLRAGEIAAQDLENILGFKLSRALLRVYGEALWISKDDQEMPVICFVLPTKHPRRILVVDDVEADARLYRLYLAARHYVVELARNQAELAEQLAQACPDMIILDVLMPHWDGWAVLQRLKTLPETANIPVVICSVLSQPELALSLGAAAVLQKPLREEHLLQAVDSLLT